MRKDNIVTEYDLAGISVDEHNLVRRASAHYGKFFTVPEDLVKFLHHSVVSIDVCNSVYVSFYSQYDKAFYLSLLSCVRLHSLQAQFNLRLAIEAAQLAIYSLYNHEHKNFVKKQADGMLKSVIKDRHFSFLETKFPKESKLLKEYKDDINGMFAHSNFITSQMTFDLDDNQYYSSFWDDEAASIEKASLWRIGNTVLQVLAMLSAASKEVRGFHLRPDFSEKYQSLIRESDANLLGIAQHTELKKWQIKKLPQLE